MASTSDPRFSISQYFPTVEYKNDSGATEQTIDFFNPDGANFVNSLRADQTFRWNPSLRLDVLAYQQFGSVSAWWLPLFFDGASHSSELKSGSLLVVPRPNERIISDKQQSPGRGSRVLL